MSKGLEALREIKKELKAFEIIKKYPRCSLQMYINFNEFVKNGYELTRENLFLHDIPCSVEEYKIVIEVLLLRLTHIAENKDKRRNKESTLKIRNKLFELENIEEKYGIEILTVYKAMVDGCYYLDYRGEIVHFIPSERNSIYLDIGNESVNLMYADSYEVSGLLNTTLFFKKYGKTWALTKEELL